MTQVVPPLESSLPIVKDAKRALGDDFSYVTFEGYLVGKMFINIINSIDGQITRRSFISAVRNSEFDIGGVKLAFKGDNQGSDLVTTTYYSNNEYRPLTDSDWLALF